MMNKNVGGLDRGIRIGTAVIIGALLFTGQISGSLATLVSIAGIALLVTGLIGWCPAYLPLGLSTCKSDK